MTKRPGPSLAIMVAAGSIIAAIALGVRSTFGLFIDPIVDSIGVDKGTIGLAIAIQNLMWGVAQPFAGAVADRFGTARVLAVGAVGYAAGIVVMSQATSGSDLIVSGFIIGVATGAASFAVVLAAIGRVAPVERRSMALGITTAMGSAGQIVLLPLTRSLLDTNDWQRVLQILAAIAVVIVIATPFLRSVVSTSATAADEPVAVPLRQELRRAAHARSYILLNAAFFVCGFHVTFIGTHLPGYVEQLGQPGATASTALALVGLFNIAGSLAAGVLGAKHSKTKLLAGIYLSRAVVIAAFVLAPKSVGATIAFGAAMGVLWLSTVPLTSGIVAQQFGTAHAGTLFGIVFLAHQLGAFLGAWLGGELADATDSYVSSWWIAIALGLFATVMHLMIDEGPVPEPPPPAESGLRIAPAGGVAALALVAGSAAALAPARAAADTPDGADAAAVPAIYCPIAGSH